MSSAADGTREQVDRRADRRKRFIDMVVRDVVKAWSAAWAPVLFLASGMGLVAALPLTLASLDGHGPTHWTWAVPCWLVAAAAPAVLVAEWLADRWRKAGE
jgi:hypothetical protein